MHKNITRLLSLPLILGLGWISPIQAQELTGADTAGVSHNLSQIVHTGTPVVLVYWQTWCGSCAKEAPHAQAAATELGDRARFFGVVSGPDSIVDGKKVSKWIEKHGLDYPQLRDRDGSLSKAFTVKGTPTIIVLGKDHKLLYRGTRLPKDWSTILPE